MLTGSSTSVPYSDAGAFTLLWNRSEMTVNCHFLAVKNPQAQYRILKWAMNFSGKVFSTAWTDQHLLQFLYRVLGCPGVTRRKNEVWIHSISDFVFHAALICVLIISDFFQKEKQPFTEGCVCGNSAIKPFTEPSSSLPTHVLALALQQNNNLLKAPWALCTGSHSSTAGQELYLSYLGLYRMKSCIHIPFACPDKPSAQQVRDQEQQEKAGGTSSGHANCCHF